MCAKTLSQSLIANRIPGVEAGFLYSKNAAKYLHHQRNNLSIVVAYLCIQTILICNRVSSPHDYLHSLRPRKASIPAAEMRAAIFLMVIMAIFAAMAVAGPSPTE